MDAFALISLSAVLLSSTSCVNSLELKSVEEGSCGTYPSLPINMTWLLQNAANIKYFGGGSKYNVYSATAQLPNLFPSLREFELYYDSCFEGTINLSSGIGSLYGFGELLGDFKIRPGDPETEPTALYFVKIGQPQLTLRHQVTLTDYKSFIFFANCWTDSNQRAWSFATFKPNLDEEAIRMIEAHAEQLGFQRENFVFFRYDTCPSSEEDVSHN
ncbi:uncharacterized protein LOC119078921 [Bradysia coprophila]|uniref:uncharacterized protein LOC119078921 n=1 Tax=Bradysia coprophila TaxID=38358 RepID=UPI00187D9516|nr:uncharacterized protein LOC119078921 [Bradysia coprophila]